MIVADRRGIFQWYTEDMKPRFIYIHGNQAEHWSFAFATWLKDQLEKSGYETFFETMPDSIIARAQYWLPFLKKYTKAGSDDVLVCWSSGTVAAMRYAEENRVKGLILISPYYTDLNDELEKQSGYFDKPWEWEKIKSNVAKIVVFYGDDDPYIPQEEFEYIADKLGCEKIKIHGVKHFIEQREFPELLDYIHKNYA
jgi:predicted alpha/beta hydrolase family esterase